MSVPAEQGPLHLESRRWWRRRRDLPLQGLTLAAAAAVVAMMILLGVKVFQEAAPAISHFGAGFITSTTWDPVKDHYGAAYFIWGTVITSAIALFIAVPLAIGIGYYLAELAARPVRGVVGTLVELLAAIPSVVLGLWGILVLGPFMINHLEPWLHSWFGWIPAFSGSPEAVGMLPAGVILAIMILPIIASLTRELFLSVPKDVKEGAFAMGATRWEVFRGAILPFTLAGVAGAVILGLARAIGEAIAVTQVIGGNAGIRWSLFESGDTLASRIAAQYQGATSNLQVSAIAYLAAILLVLSLITNLGARFVIDRVQRRRFGG